MELHLLGFPPARTVAPRAPGPRCARITLQNEATSDLVPLDPAGARRALDRASSRAPNRYPDDRAGREGPRGLARPLRLPSAPRARSASARRQSPLRRHPRPPAGVPIAGKAATLTPTSCAEPRISPERPPRPRVVFAPRRASPHRALAYAAPTRFRPPTDRGLPCLPDDPKVIIGTGPGRSTGLVPDPVAVGFRD